MKKELIIVFLSILGLQPILYGQSVKIKGSWTVKSSVNDLYAGEDINSTVTSDADQIELSVSGNLNKSTWKISVSKSDVVWNNALEVWVRRTGTGNGSGEVWGGTTYQKVNNVNMTFFEGKRAVNKIPIQLEIRGMSVTIPAISYSTSIVYTLYEY